MTRTRSRVTLPIAVACCVLAGCGRDGQPRENAALAADSLPADSVFSPSEERVSLPSSRIYYTLTSHDWYARGQPLVHDGRPYEPEGMPISASLAQMTRVGDFDGVEYYVLDGDAEPAVYVPVFEGYWQRFRADPSGAAAPVNAVADSAGDAATDSVPGLD